MQSMPFQIIYIMKKFIFFSILLTTTTLLQAQDKYGYRWEMLFHQYVDFRNNQTKIGTIQPQPFYSAGEFGTTMCNKYGELMFQTGGCFILNKNFTIMKNGDSINSKYTYNFWCDVRQGDGTFPFHQSSTYNIEKSPHASTRIGKICFKKMSAEFYTPSVNTKEFLLKSLSAYVERLFLKKVTKMLSIY